MSQRKGLLNALSGPGGLRTSLYPRSLHADRVENVAEGNLRKAAYTGAPAAASSGSKGNDSGARGAVAEGMNALDQTMDAWRASG